MKVYDKDNELLAVLIQKNSSKIDKDFHTEPSSEFQIATFNLKKDNNIQRHYHEKQERKVFSTSEVIILQSGKMKITIYDSDQNKVEDFLVAPGDMVALVDGGHEIEILEDSNFIEVKQGPYFEQKDKTRF